MEKLDKALQVLLGLPEGDTVDFYSRSENRERYNTGNLTKDETSVNLRLDFELSEEVVEDPGFNAKARNEALIGIARNDLEDLIINGDVNKSADPLLKCINGEKVRGKSAVEIEILAASLLTEHKPRKNSYEYTLFLRPFVRFE